MPLHKNLIILPLILVQFLILVSNPTKLPCFVHTSAAVPFITSISIDVTAILKFLASTLNINPFRLIHFRIVDDAPSTTSRTHDGAGSLKYSSVGNGVGIFVVGRDVGFLDVGATVVGILVIIFVGCRDEGVIVGVIVCFGILVGIFVGCRDDGFNVGLAVVGFPDVGLVVGNFVVG